MLEHRVIGQFSSQPQFVFLATDTLARFPFWNAQEKQNMLRIAFGPHRQMK